LKAKRNYLSRLIGLGSILEDEAGKIEW
jgi:hypothetical protein